MVGSAWGDTVPLPRQVLTVDARNHGSSPHSPVMTYEAMSLDVQHLLSRLGITKCILVGHSMGGKTAMTLALQRVGRHGGGSGVTGSGSSRGACRKGVAPSEAVHQCQPCPQLHRDLSVSGWVLSHTEL